MQAAEKLADRDPPPLRHRPTKHPSRSKGGWGAAVKASAGAVVIALSADVGGSGRRCTERTSAKTAARVLLGTHFSSGRRRSLCATLALVHPAANTVASTATITRKLVPIIGGEL